MTCGLKSIGKYTENLERGWCVYVWVCVCVRVCVWTILWGKSIWIIETKNSELSGPGGMNGDLSIRDWHRAALLPADLQGQISYCDDKRSVPRSSSQIDEYFFRRFNSVSCSASLRIQSWFSWGRQRDTVASTVKFPSKQDRLFFVKPDTLGLFKYERTRSQNSTEAENWIDFVENWPHTG